MRDAENPISSININYISSTKLCSSKVNNLTYFDSDLVHDFYFTSEEIAQVMNTSMIINQNRYKLVIDSETGSEIPLVLYEGMRAFFKL